MAWASVGLITVMMLINVVIPVYFRILVDFVVPMKSVSGLVGCLTGFGMALVLYALLRTAVRFTQSEARDRLELELMRTKWSEEVRAIEAGRWDRVESLGQLPSDALTKIAELGGTAPSQIVGGLVYLSCIIASLWLMAGPLTAVIGVFIFALKLCDVLVVARQAKYVAEKTAAVGAFRRLEQHLLASGRSLFGLRLGTLSRPKYEASLSEVRSRYDELRFAQFRQDTYLNVSTEFLALLAFVIAGYQSFYGKITFGEFLFLITLLTQLHLPIGMLLDSVLELVRMKDVLGSVESALFPPEAVATPSPASPFRSDFRVALCGPSGSGKTTKALEWYREWLAQGLSPESVCLVPQHVDMFPTESHHYLAPHAGAALGIERLLTEGRTAEVLSGGERRKVLILRALELRPSILVLDEPEAGLDEESRVALLNLLSRELAGRAFGLVLISHDPRFQALVPNRLELRAFEGKRAGNE
jgi:ABC-type bacteriocin/lantibiotic exporter with double-glycine peptidase domain